MSQRHFISGGRYPVLRTLGILYLIGAGVSVLVGIAACIWALASAPANWGDRLMLAVGVLAATFFLFITMLAIAEVLKLVIDIEHNTRMTAMNSTPMPSDPMAKPTDGGVSMPQNRLHTLDEETAEAALLRGH
ncbi:MAG: hypothetical protein IT447_03800 [Phycisphaerales bacterium]|nr:hypothetical protein [Phycisphaerales bacterium]